ncbi:MAG: DEAD/DEAH box helicase, partial [Atribacterota bacterium]
MTESMKIVKLKNYGIPSHFVNIWEKDYPKYLLPLQEEAVRNYGILDCNGSTGLPRRFAPRNDKRENARNDGERLPRRFAPRNDKIGALCNDKISPSPYPLPSRERERKNENNNLLVIAPTSSGKTFIGEMAAIAQAVHLRKTIYLVPSRALADEKY